MKVKRQSSGESPKKAKKTATGTPVTVAAEPLSGKMIWKHAKEWTIPSFFDKCYQKCMCFSSDDDQRNEDWEEWSFTLAMSLERPDRRKYITLWVRNNKKCKFNVDYNQDFKSLQCNFKVQILDREGCPIYSFSYKQLGCFDHNVRIRNCVTLEELLKLRNRFQDNGSLSLRFQLIEVRLYGDPESCSSTSFFDQDMAGMEHRKSSSVTFKRMFDEMIFPDMSVKTTEKLFPCHKGVLATASSIFSTLLNSKVKENENILDLSNVLDAETVDDMLKFIYTGGVPNIEKTCEKLLRASDLYNLNPLKQRCEKEVSKTLTIENAADILQLAVKHNAPLLKEKTVLFIITYSDEVLASEGWKKIPDNVSKELFSNFISLVDQLS